VDAFIDLYAAHPFWVWLGWGALLLAVEAGTGSGWLLWPAASAGVVALLSLTGIIEGPAVEIGVFAALTLLTTIAARRWFVQPARSAADINDPALRLVGQVGEVCRPVVNGRGRVFAGGAEWPADLDGGGDLAPGARVVVTAVSGPRLIVRPAP
jgi:hypothetical protein